MAKGGIKGSRAWYWFATYIKLRDNYTCITCGKQERGAGMGAGHFIPAFGHQYTYFNETNVHAQCSNCNGWDTSSLLRYRRKIVEKYGAEYDEFLEKEGRKYRQITPKELKEIATTYRLKVKKLLGKYKE